MTYNFKPLRELKISEENNNNNSNNNNKNKKLTNK